MLRGLWRCLAVIVVTLFAVAPALAEKRVALVIGNSNYQAVPQLPNPANDAAAFARVLQEAGFDQVVLKTDLGIDAFRQSLREFTALAADADTAVFYYAGHGLEVGGVNMLVPVDAKLRTDLDAEDETVSVDRVLRALDQTRRLRLVILDACRDNPFVPGMKHVSASRSVSRGFERIEQAPPDTMIAFATEPGSVAADGNGRDSPFTQALMNDVATPGLDLRIALGKVRDDVLKATEGRQRPYVTGSLGGSNEPLVPSVAQPAAEPAEAPKTAESKTAVPTPEASDSTASDFKFAEGVASVAGWQAFLRLHPQGPLSDLAADRLAALQRTVAAEPAPQQRPAPPAQAQPDAPPPEPQARLEPPPSPRAIPPQGADAAGFVVGGLDPYGDNFLSLRSAPTTSAVVLRRLSPGTPLSVDRHSGSWASVRTEDGAAGWVSGRFLLPRGGQAGPIPDDEAPAAKAPAPHHEAYAFVTGLDPYGDNFLALKAEPDLHAKRIMKMGPGTKLRVFGHDGEWTQVEVVGGPSGWAASRYVGCCR